MAIPSKHGNETQQTSTEPADSHNRPGVKLCRYTFVPAIEDLITLLSKWHSKWQYKRTDSMPFCTIKTINQSIHLSIYLSPYLSIYFFVYLSIYLSISISIYLILVHVALSSALFYLQIIPFIHSFNEISLKPICLNFNYPFSRLLSKSITVACFDFCIEYAWGCIEYAWGFLFRCSKVKQWLNILILCFCGWSKTEPWAAGAWTGALQPRSFLSVDARFACEVEVIHKVIRFIVIIHRHLGLCSKIIIC